MSSFWLKFLAIALIFLGEIAVIYAEIAASKNQLSDGSNTLSLFLKMFILAAVGSAPLIAGYMIGVRVFYNIWVVAVISITSILLIEPILVYAFFKQFPTLGAGIGFVLGMLGLAAALFL